MAAQPPIQLDDPSAPLALAMIYSSPTPLLMIDEDTSVIAASVSFCDAFAVDPIEAVGRPMCSLGDGEWDVPQLRVLLSATASGDADIESYELDLNRAGLPTRRLVIKARKLAYGDDRSTRLLVAVHDVTEQRVQAQRSLALARDNALLLHETRHRVANSLQIIASVMMLNARRTSSEETRRHLRDAHNRVMSIAELQLQLAVSTLGTVSIAGYLRRLCETISASMIADPDVISIRVEAPDAAVDGEVSVSLGLIVTELVINALKHAFPREAGGTIIVCYSLDAIGWTLSVADDGLGMGRTASALKGGLGTSIVQALARQLRARVEVSGLGPGTRVAIVHQQAPSLSGGPDDVLPEPAV